MKSRFFLCLMVCVVLICSVSFVMPRNGLAQGLNYKIIRVQYYEPQPGYVRLLSHYVIYNTGLFQDITLGKIYITTPDGLNGEVTTYTGFEGTTIPPLGSFYFNVSQLGIQPNNVALMIVTWDGPAGPFKLTGGTETYGQDPWEVIGTANFDAFE